MSKLGGIKTKLIQSNPLEILAYSFIVLYSLLLIIGLLIHDYFWETDGIHMMFAAKSILSGDGYGGYSRDFWPPLYPFLTALVYLVSGDWFISGKIVSLVSSIIFLIFSYRLAHLLGQSKFTALLVLLLIMLVPDYFRYSIEVENVMLFCMLTNVGFFYFFHYLEEGSDRSNLLSAGFIALATLTRYTGYVILLSLIVILVLKKWDARILFQYMGIFLLIQLPWWIISYISTGSPFYNKNHLNFASAHYSNRPHFWYEESPNYHSLFDVITRHSLHDYYFLLVKNMVDMIVILRDGILYTKLLLVVFIPLAIDNYGRKYVLSVYLWVVFIAFHLPAWIFVEYFFAHLVFIFFPLANSSSLFLEKPNFPNLRKSFLALVLIVLSITSLYLHNPIHEFREHEAYFEGRTDYENIGHFLMKYSNDTSEYIMALSPGYSFEASLNFITLPGKNNLSLQDRILLNHLAPSVLQINPKFPFNNSRPRPTYLVIDVLTTNSLKELSHLLHNELSPPFLNPLYTTSIAVVYEIDYQLLLIKNSTG